MRRPLGQKGQTSLPEYVVTFFIVVGVVVAMTTYIQRGLQARIHDAHKYMIKSASDHCDQDCVDAAGGKITYEYEPYYGNITSDTDHSSEETKKVFGTQGADGLFQVITNDDMSTQSVSRQLPPKEAVRDQQGQ